MKRGKQVKILLEMGEVRGVLIKTTNELIYDGKETRNKFRTLYQTDSLLIFTDYIDL